MATITEIKKQNSIAITKPSISFSHEENWQVSTWLHRAWFSAGCAAVLITLAKSLFLSPPGLKFASATVIGYLAADLATGLYHWAIDNYGSAETPIFGSQIDGFQDHHQQPWAITKRQLANNLHIPAAAVTAAVLPIVLLCRDAFLLGFVGVFAGCVMFSQQFHSWAHTPKRNIPAVVAALQDYGVLVGRAEHAAHHRPPYNSNYCIVSGVWNRLLDESRFFTAAEVVVLHLVGVEPRSWKEPNSEWTQRAPSSG